MRLNINTKMGNQPSSPIKTCLSSAVGDIAWPSEPLFKLLDAKPYNLDVSVNPVAITYPSKVEEVAAIIKCAGTDYKIQARSGGHSYANYGKQFPPASHFHSTHFPVLKIQLG